MENRWMTILWTEPDRLLKLVLNDLQLRNHRNNRSMISRAKMLTWHFESADAWIGTSIRYHRSCKSQTCFC